MYVFHPLRTLIRYKYVACVRGLGLLSATLPPAALAILQAHALVADIEADGVVTTC